MMKATEGETCSKMRRLLDLAQRAARGDRPRRILRIERGSDGIDADPQHDEYQPRQNNGDDL